MQKVQKTEMQNLENQGNLYFTDLGIERLKHLMESKQKLMLYVSGCFDLLHFGHTQLFMRIKELIPNSEIMVGVFSDYDIRMKNRRNVMYEEERIKLLQSCRYVDYILFPAPIYPKMSFYDEKGIDFVFGEIIGWDSDMIVVDSLEKELNEIECRLKEKIKNIKKWRVEQNGSNILLSHTFLHPIKGKVSRAISKRLFSNLLKADDQLPQLREKYHTSDEENIIHEDLTELTNIETSDINEEIVEDPTHQSQLSSIAEDQQILADLSSEGILSLLRGKGMYIENSTPKVRSSNLVLRILRNREACYERNIKKGFSSKSLKISCFDYWRIRIKLAIKSICQTKVRRNIESFKFPTL